MTQAGYRAYAKSQNTTDTPRALEYRLLGQVTAAMIEARDNPKDVPKLVDALLWNKTVWDHFLLDLQHDANQLPLDLKRSLIDLALWVNRETQRVLDDDSDMDALIEVNQHIMEGLR